MSPARIFLIAALVALAPALALAEGPVGAGEVAQSAFEKGRERLQYDKPAEAAPYLEKAVQDPGADERAWLYLGLCYQMTGKLDAALAAYRKGLGQASSVKSLYYSNIGDVYTLQGKNTFAVDSYTQALELDPSMSGPYLKRANARLNTKDYPSAKDDYAKYLELEPGSPQRPTIEKIIELLGAGIARAEQQAAAEEAKKQAEEAARKELLEKMAASLKAAADETTSISAGAGDVQGYGDELKIDE